MALSRAPPAPIPFFPPAVPIKLKFSFRLTSTPPTTGADTLDVVIGGVSLPFSVSYADDADAPPPSSMRSSAHSHEILYLELMV
jgi:hypothetical protein